MEFREFVERHGVPTAPDGHHHARRGWVQFDCPFCSPRSGRWRMGYSTARGVTTCWVCGPHRLWETLQALGVPVPAIRTAQDGLRRRAVERAQHVGTYRPPCGLGPLHPAHRRYLTGRGYDPDRLVALWGLQGFQHHARLGWRIYAPINRDGRPVSWTTRSTRDTGQRWISAKAEEEAIPAGQLLYGLDYCRNAVIVHEGPTDVWKTGPGAVGVFGVGNHSDAQIWQLSRFAVRAVCFDNSPDARKRAVALCATLAPFPGTTHLVELDADDPGSATRAETEKLRRAFLE